MATSPSSDSREAERRRNPELRELLDELLALVRHLSHRAETLTVSETDYARHRLEWLADEIWANLASYIDRAGVDSQQRGAPTSPHKTS
ncbi:MAG TPA: hypothetical protein VNA21_09470 [Steroidobacteraceae bacterium]|nr:hypothetical protein [Steroidobacteraceae bacterium]